MTDPIRDLLISLALHMAYMQGQLEARHELDDPEDYYWYRESVLLRQKVTDALADEPAVREGREPAAVTGQPRPMDEDWDALVNRLWSKYETIGYQGERFMYEGDFCTALDLVRQEIAHWGNPAPAPPADGEVAELVAALQSMATDADRRCRFSNAERLSRAAELLERQALVPVAVSDALIKAECALSDIAEGEPMTDEGDPLKWAERRCADTLAVIRPTMMQHKIRTSEWPPVAATAKPLPEVGE